MFLISKKTRVSSFTTCCMTLSKQGSGVFAFVNTFSNNQRSFLRDVFSFFEQRLGSIKKRLLILIRLRALVLNTPTTKFLGGITTLILTIETSQRKPREANKTMIATEKDTDYLRKTMTILEKDTDYLRKTMTISEKQ